jgi:pSer/pThr/pTyr-binding forkhead associated (FHA) protein
MSYEDIPGPALIVQHTGQVFPLAAQVVTLGTAEDNTIVLADPEVSVYHARVTWDPDSGAYFLEDLGSVEGTYINERAIVGPRMLNDGDLLRLGNTTMEVYLGPGGLFGEEERRSPLKSPLVAGLVVAFLAGVTILCVLLFSLLFFSGRRGTPTVTIQSPAEDSRIAAGSQVPLQVSASGASDITLLEVSVDGVLVATGSSPDSAGTSLLTVVRSWVFDTPGEHQISAQAFTARGRVSELATAEVTVLGAEATPTPEPSATLTPTPTETPEPTPTFTATPEPPTPEPTIPPPPRIEYFQASPATISFGDCTNLQWGRVDYATDLSIEPEIGAITAPGSREVCPSETIAYLLTASGPGGTSTASTTVTVVGGRADLVIEGISFEPSPPIQDQETNVRITIRNSGDGTARAFDWEWQAGSDAFFDGRVSGLEPGRTTVVAITWTPVRAYAELGTQARVDTANEVTESDETNNQLTAVVQVLEAPAGPEVTVVRSDAALDGFLLNDGTGSDSQDIIVGNGRIVEPTGELVSRGFLSFDLADIPSGATIEGVELRFYQKAIQGAPYDKLGNLMLEQIDYGSSLEPGAYDLPALDSAGLAQLPAPNSWYILSDPTITSWVQSALDNDQNRFQLRLRFTQEADGDSEEDWIAIEPGGPVLSSPNAPALTITYRP